MCLEMSLPPEAKASKPLPLTLTERLDWTRYEWDGPYWPGGKGRGSCPCDHGVIAIGIEG
jgi:hypothetical protein